MQVIEAVGSLRQQVNQWRQAGLKVGFVPTMGNLHEGHLSLLGLARTKVDRVVVSIFVNPLQFGPNEDFERYPRTFEQDQALFSQRGADLLFAPSVEEIYPYGQAQTLVCVPQSLTGLLEGASRPGHFDGVTTVVMKLLQMVQPDLAVFGQKDYQQLKVIQRMVRDLAMPIEIISGAIARDSDGLALSSRNQYLTEADRAIAPKLFVTLQDLAMAIASGNRQFNQLEQTAVSQLLEYGFDAVDYVKIVDSETLQPIESKEFNSECIILAVARLKNTRLLDNFLLKID